MATETTSFKREMLSTLPSLRAFAVSLTGKHDKADDLVQDTVMKAWAKQSSFEMGTNIKAWLFTILRNTYYTQISRRRREVRDETGEYANNLSSPPTQDWSVAMRALQAGLARLPDEHREALILVGAGGFAYEEAAEICQCAVGTVKSRVSRARKALQATLERGGYSRDGRAAGDAMRSILADADRLSGARQG